MKYILTILFCLISIKSNSLELTLSQGTVKPTPIAITNLYSFDSSVERLGENISSVISDNLERSGLFISIDKKAFIQTNESLSNQPRFEDWKILKAQHLLSGKIESNGNKISIEFRLFDVFAQKQIVGKRYETSKNNWRRVAHIISDAIFNRITGEISYGRIPAGSVVVSGNLPSSDGSYSLYCAVIVKQVDAKTRSKVGINELLRGI